ncbi:RNA12 protein-domain-containing protein [Lasiosphaeria hispida]|uniref:Mitochondrial escape protein 2 n=1 Tax=Lasiosphaeria hispida TaxID=260671 RepID=A0AAJ0HAD7_9PEZI|nr:RNA12 protein-domain-containing protein [Lasiosphaeria hispida]
MITGRTLFRPAGLRGLAVPLTARCIANASSRRPLARYGGPPAQTQRGESTLSEDKKSGHIHAAPNESILFFDNLFPLKLTPVMLWRPWSTRRDLSELHKQLEDYSRGMLDPINLVKKAIPKGVPINVTEIIPRLKDGGAFVKFTHPNEITASEIEDLLSKQLEEHPIKPWFNPFLGIKTGLVRGRPWLEDLYRFPKSRIRVEFVASSDDQAPSELSQETLYSIFRRYGKIADITSQPSDSKVLPKFAHVDFVLVRDAIMARNCMHGYLLQEEGSKSVTRLRLAYEQRVKPHHVWNWITNHPRIVIPIIAGFLAAFTVAVFDPIREFFVKAHVQRIFEFTNSRLYKWFQRQTSDILAFRKHKGDQAGLNALVTHRKDVIDSIQNGLLEATATFVVIHGPRGSGKRELILDQVLEGRKDVLVLDCKPVVEARGEAGTLKKLAAQVGYRPVFSWTNNISSLVDLAIQSTTGVKASFSENLESQLVKILQVTASALKEVSLADKKETEKDAALSEDAYLEAHPERRAVVVIDSFLHKSEEKGIVYEKIADWAAALVQSNVAHVVFLTNDTSYSKSLSKSLPDRVFHQVTLGDLSPDVAKQFVISQLDPEDSRAEKDDSRAEKDDSHAEKSKQAIESSNAEKERREDLKELDECIDQLGGRLTDLQVLTRRLKIGQSPKKAVSDIIEQSASEILRMFLLAKDAGEGDKRWSTEQAWYLIKQIAQQETLRYNEVLLSDTFTSSKTPGASNGEAALESLANAELITVKSIHGRPQTIRAGKPVYQAAFNRLFKDNVVKARMDMALFKELAGIEAKIIEKAEAELSLLGTMPTQPSQMRDRIYYLLDKMQASQNKIMAYEKDIRGSKKVLSREA